MIALDPKKLLAHPIIEKASSVIVGLSGGIDSVVLLHLCWRYFRQGKIQKLCAVHVNHHLSTHACQWADFCAQLCAQWSIPLVIESVSVHVTPRTGVEHAARMARYRAFSRHMTPNACLLLAHHQNDQAETVLFRMIRGSNVYGLRAIPKQRVLGEGRLYRPLLSLTRTQIEQYARTCTLSWVEDDTNDQLCYDRNFIRKCILPLFEQRWPQTFKALEHVAWHCNETQMLLEEMAQQDLQKAHCSIQLPLLGEVFGLDCSVLQTGSMRRLQNVLTYWLRKKNISMPKATYLKRLCEMVGPDPCVFEIKGLTFTIRRYMHVIFIDTLEKWHPVMPQRMTTDIMRAQEINDEFGFPFSFIVMQGAPGIKSNVTHVHLMSRCYAPSLPTFALPGRQGKKSLKKWLNEYKVPRWIRREVPLVICDQQLVMVPGLLVNANFVAAEGVSSWNLVWCQ